MIDSSKLRSPEDIRADDLGVWVNNGVRCCFVTCKSSSNKVISNIKVISKGDPLPSQYYQLVRSYFYHKQSKDFKRTIFQLYGRFTSSIIIKGPVASYLCGHYYR